MPNPQRVLILSAILALLTSNASAQTYRDVAPHHWALPAIERLAETGVMIGDHAGYFNGAEPLSRYELAVILDRLMRHQEAAIAAAASESLDTANALEQLDRLGGRVDDLYALFEQILSTQNIDLSHVNARLVELDAVSDTLRRMQNREPIAGPPGPQGPAGAQGPTGAAGPATPALDLDPLIARVSVLEEASEALASTQGDDERIDALLERIGELERRIDDLIATPARATPAPAVTLAPAPTAPAVPLAPDARLTTTPTGTAAGEFGYWTSWGATPTAPQATPTEPTLAPVLEPVIEPVADPATDPATEPSATEPVDHIDNSTAASTLDEWCAQRPNNPICE